MNGSGIYLISNLANDKSYVGSTGSSVGFLKRWRYHVQDLNAGRHGNSYLQAAWNKYGADNIGFMALEKCGDDRLIDREVFWVNRFDSMNPDAGYNLVHPNRSMFSALTRSRMRNARIGRKMPASAYAKIRRALMGNTNALGHVHSAATREKIRLKATGRPSKIRGLKNPAITSMLIKRHAARKLAYSKTPQFRIFKRLFNSGWSYSNLSAQFGKTYTWSWKIAKRYGLTRPKRIYP